MIIYCEDNFKQREACLKYAKEDDNGQKHLHKQW